MSDITNLTGFVANNTWFFNEIAGFSSIIGLGISIWLICKTTSLEKETKNLHETLSKKFNFRKNISDLNIKLTQHSDCLEKDILRKYPNDQQEMTNRFLTEINTIDGFIKSLYLEDNIKQEIESFKTKQIVPLIKKANQVTYDDMWNYNYALVNIRTFIESHKEQLINN